LSELNTHKAKRIASLIVSQYPDRFSSDFEKNKKSLDELLIFPSKSMRNKVAGYITRIAKRAEGSPAEQGTTVEESAEISVAEQAAEQEEKEGAKPAATEAPQQEGEKKPRRERKSRRAQTTKAEKGAQQASAQPAATQEAGAQAAQEGPSPAAEEIKSETDQKSSQEKPG